MTEPLEDLWAKLARQGSAASGWLRLRVPGFPEVPLYIATNSSTNLDGLILEIPTQSVDPSALSERSKGLELTSERLTPGRSGTTRLILALTEPTFRDVFRALCTDLVSSLSGLTNLDHAAGEFSRRLKRWQRFLQSHGAGGLSEAACLGLVGELVVLRELLMGASDPARAVEAWTGPDGEARDFTLPEGDIEVKATGNPSPSEIGISSLQQLDTQTGRRLIVFHIVALRNPSAGMTLPELVEDVAELSSDAIALFRDRLLTAGYLEEHSGLYHLPRYQIAAQEAYEVASDFPTLTSANVPAGVTRAAYEVSLSAIRTCHLDDFEPASFLHRARTQP